MSQRQSLQHALGVDHCGEGRHYPLKLQELHAAIVAGVASGPGVNADAVFDRLTQKYQTAADADKGAS